jgi:hypothetical protein
LSPRACKKWKRCPETCAILRWRCSIRSPRAGRCPTPRSPSPTNPSIKPGVDRPEFATFVVGQGGAIRQLDISLPFAGIYAKQDHDAVRAAFVECVQRRKFLVIFDQLGERIGGFALGGAKDEEWASAKNTEEARRCAES